MNAASADEKVPSGFETNAGSFRGGKNIPPGDKAAFRDFLHKRQEASGKYKPAYVPPAEPTAERKAKGDRPKKTQGGFYRAPPPIERLRDRNQLDKKPHVSCAMCEAATKLYTHFYEAGLHGIAAQDLTREMTGGGKGGLPASQFPRTERAMHHRQTFREACRVMGWYETFPLRGAGRLVVDVVCYDRGVEDAARVHIGPGRLEIVRDNGMDRLREGLFALARHWRLI